MIGTGWSILISPSVIDDESINSQVILTDNKILPKNNFRINPRTFFQPETHKTSMEMSKQDIPPPNHQVVQTLGDTRLFWVPDLSTEDPLEFYQINATLKSIGEHSMIYSNLSSVSAATILAMNNKFETIIYPTLKDFFGPPPDIDNNNKTIILVFNILDGLSGGQFVSGFFYSINQYLNDDLKPSLQFSNEAEILHIDGKEGLSHLEDGKFETIAHEFQHMIHFGLDSDENIWVDEGASMFAEYLIGEDPFNTGSYKSRFSSNPDVSLTYWDYHDSQGLAMANYGAAYAFFLYLSEHYGGSSIIQNIVNRSGDGISSILYALKSEGYSVQFKEVFRNWTLANFLDNYPFVNEAFRYNNISISMDLDHSTYYSTSVPLTENSVPYWGTDYFKFASRMGAPFNLEFQGDITSDFMVTAILTNTTTTPQNTEVIPIEISADEFGNFSIETLGISADEIVIAVSSYTPLGKNDHNDEEPAPAQDYWFMINPKGIIVSSGNLTFSTEGSYLYIWNIDVSDQNGVYWQEAGGATYYILTISGENTGINGNLTFNSEIKFWESEQIDISELDSGNNTYRIKYHFFNSSYSGIAYSETFEIVQESETQSSSSSSTTVDNTPIPGFILVISVLAIGFLIINRKKK